MKQLSTLSTVKLPQILQLPSKDLIKGPQRGPEGFYLLLILLTNAKAGTDNSKRMFHVLTIEDAKLVT
jgi:hypothetical protein